MAITLSGAHWLERFDPAIIPGFPFTFALWFRGPAAPNHTILAWGYREHELTEFHSLGFTLDGLHLQGDSRIPGSPPGLATSGPAFTPNVWTHAAATFVSATERHVWQNGVRQDISTTPVPFQGRTLTIGAQAQSTPGGGTAIGKYTGSLAHVAVYGVALSADELVALAKGWSPLAIQPEALRAYYPFERPDAIDLTWRDRWRNSYHVTQIGAGTIGHVDGPPVFLRRRRATMVTPTAPTTAPSLVLVAPPHLAEDVWPVTLRWAAFGADRFDVYFAVAGSPLTLISANQSATSLANPPGVLPDGRSYAWRVVAKNAIGTTTSPDFTFTTLQPPAAVGDPRPRDGAVNVPAGGLIAWGAAAHATGYHVWFAEGADPLVQVAANQPGTLYAPPRTDNSTSYRWRIDAVNAVGTTVGSVWTFTTAPGPAFPQRFILEAALGGSFRDELVTFSHNVATWPIADAIRAGARAHDISGRSLHGTWNGSGFGAVAPFDTIPEGVLGSTFTGNAFAEVPTEATPSTTHNLSLANGDVDIACAIKGLVIDAAERSIVAKQDGGVSGNGYHLSVQSGRIVLYLQAGGVLIVRLVSKIVLDAGEHIITAHYETANRRASIAVDGVIDVVAEDLSGAELTYTAAPLRIGAFGSATAGDGSGFKGTLAYVSIGREGDRTWGPRLQATRAWTDLSADVRNVTPIEIRTGIPGNTPTDRVATTGTLAFALDNSTRRTARGAYTPGHPRARTGWRLAVPIRFSVVFGERYYEFHGRLAEVRPLPGLHGSQHVDCTVTDWMDVAAGTPLSALPVQINQRSDQVLAAVLAQAQGRSPINLDLHPGRSTFPYAIDGNAGRGDAESTDTMLTELGRVLASEDGFLYIRGDTVRGGLLRFEAHAERDQTPVLVRIGNTMQAVDVAYSLERLVNIVRITYTPRRVDANVHPLYELTTHTDRQPIEAGETRVFEGSYVDPDNIAERVGGLEMVPLVPNVDYGMNANPFGTGANLTSQLAIVSTLGGSSFRVELTNHSGQDAFLYVTPSVSLQVRGKAVFHYKPATEERRDGESVRTNGPRTLSITLPYEANPAAVAALADYYLALYRRADPIPSSVTINGNRDSTHMRYCLSLQPGDKIALAEPMTGLTLLPTFIVHEKRLTYAAAGIVTATFGLARARPPSALTPARVGIMRLNAARLNYLLSLTRTEDNDAA